MWNFLHVPSYALYRIFRHLMPQGHPWRRDVYSFDEWCRVSSDDFMFVGLVITASLFGIVIILSLMVRDVIKL